jgi:hypothetical protein
MELDLGILIVDMVPGVCDPSAVGRCLQRLHLCANPGWFGIALSIGGVGVYLTDTLPNHFGTCV